MLQFRYRKAISYLVSSIQHLGSSPIQYLVSRKKRNIDFLKNYGWEVKSLTGIHEAKEGIQVDLENKITDKMLFEASEAIGLNPAQCIGKPIDIFLYNLTKKGRLEQLCAMIWVYKGKIAAAYIYHVESNLHIKYWSLDTSYDQILMDIYKMYREKK